MKKLLKEGVDNKIIHPIDIVKVLTAIASVLTVFYTITIYISSQEIQDKRKYNNAFYDERYKVLKQITQSISEIYVLLNRHDSVAYSKQEIKDITDRVVVFDYSYLVLDKTNRDDSLVLDFIRQYEVKLQDLVTANEIPKQIVHSLGDSVIIHCGKILINEKDVINSFKL